jgi:hypothetical protein
MVQEQFCDVQNVKSVIYEPRSTAPDGNTPAVELDPAYKSGLVRHTARLKPLLTKDGQPTFVAWKDVEEQISGRITLKAGKALTCGLGHLDTNAVQGSRATKLAFADIKRAQLVLDHIREIETELLSLPTPYSTGVVHFTSNTDDDYSCRYPNGLYHKSFRRAENIILAPENMWTKHDAELNFMWTSELFGLGVWGTWTQRALGILLPCIYGGIHLTAWNYQFPTQFESQLWKGSCSAICGFAFLADLLILGFALLSVYSDNHFEDDHDYTFGLLISIGINLLSAMYMAARAFLIVESFISLRQVPIGVYWLPSWLQMVPHG